MIAIVPLLILVVGLLLYALSSNAKVAELGRLAFVCGLLVVCMTMASKVIKVF